MDGPSNYKEMMAGPKAAEWKDIIEREMHSMYDNQVWNLLNPTIGIKIIE